VSQDIFGLLQEKKAKKSVKNHRYAIDQMKLTASRLLWMLLVELSAYHALANVEKVFITGSGALILNNEALKGTVCVFSTILVMLENAH
jgi:hypothetical protein